MTGKGHGFEMIENKLTEYECRCVIDVLNERFAGGVDDLRDALGLTNREAARAWSALERALKKLQERRV